MEVKLHNTILFEEENSSADAEKYFVVSLRWSLINEEHITFVRQEAMAYCYNMNWAGPMTKIEAKERCIKGKMLVVSLSQIRSFLVKATIDNVESYTLPNTEEVRKIIGFDAIAFQMVV